VSARFSPRTEHAPRYARAFEEYRTLYRKTKAIYARLHHDAEDRRDARDADFHDP
jgi:hypothetical protein